jgi:hypothetical protein
MPNAGIDATANTLVDPYHFPHCQQQFTDRHLQINLVAGF